MCWGGASYDAGKAAAVRHGLRALCGKPVQRCHTFLYQPVAAKLDLDKSESSIAQMHHGIALQTVRVKIMRNFSADGIGIAPKIAHGHRLEKASEASRIARQIPWPNAKSGRRHRRIGEVTRVTSPNNRPWTQTRSPCRRIFYHKYLFESVDVGPDRIFIQSGRIMVVHVKLYRRSAICGNSVRRFANRNPLQVEPVEAQREKFGSSKNLVVTPVSVFNHGTHRNPRLRDPEDSVNETFGQLADIRPPSMWHILV